MNHASCSRAAQNVWLIANREAKSRLASRVFRIATTVVLVAIIVAILIVDAASGSTTSTSKSVTIALVNTPRVLDAQISAAAHDSDLNVTTIHTNSLDEAKHGVSNGEFNAALITKDQGYSLYFKNATNAPIVNTLQAAIERQVSIASLTTEEMEKLEAARIAATIDVQLTSPPKRDQLERVAIATAAIMLLSLIVMISGQMIAQGVAEEKTTHVIEILLPAVSPLQLLWGKILGIGTLALAQMTLYAITAITVALTTNILELPNVAVSVAEISLAWFVVGFLFFGTLNAAAGALVSRREDITVAVAPITIATTAMIYAGMFSIQDPQSAWVQILSYLPPFSITIQPMLLATGQGSTIAGSVAFLIAVGACAATSLAASRVYKNSILHSGTRRRWLDALR
jgi:ABC-2 type transport system permease protein